MAETAYLGHLANALIAILSFFHGRALDFYRQDVRLITSSQLLKTYDYIVVGGGIAGCLMSKRLADAGHSTLLIHGPGTLQNDFLRTPVFNSLNVNDPKHDFQYHGPYVEAIQWPNHTAPYSSGTDLGGSQLLSAQMWSYGKAGDYSSWRKMYGISSKFNFENIRKFGRFHEDAASDVKTTDYTYGKRGEIQLRYSPTWSPFEKLQREFENSGAKITQTRITNDPNSNSLGFGKIVTAVEHRQNTAYISTPSRAFFEGKTPRKLHILTEHMVTKILFDTEVKPPRATGVDFVPVSLPSKKFRAMAKKSVIVSAGAIRSPQLLILSGVGPESLLKKFNVTPVVVREGVSKNLHDHYDIGDAKVCFSKPLGFDTHSLGRLRQFARDGQGPFASSFGVESLGFFRSSQTNISTCPDPNDVENCQPDFEMILQSLGGPTILSQERDCLKLTPTLLHPEYRGEITLTSADIFDKPIIGIDPTESPRDMSLFGELWQLVRNITNTAFKDRGGRFVDDTKPQCKDIKDQESFEFGTCQAVPFIRTAWHMAGTCRIGQRDDPLAVVDEEFRVIGVQNLMVVDGSVVPYPTSGHMLAIIAALAEMAAQALISPST